MMSKIIIQKKVDWLDFIMHVEKRLEGMDVDIIGVSAGFCRYINDWGKLLFTDDFETINAIVKDFSAKVCNNRRFAILEGGYNFMDLGKNMAAFCRGPGRVMCTYRLFFL